MSAITFSNQVLTARLPRAVIYKTLKRARRHYGRRLGRRQLSLTFLSERGIQKLNRIYRGQNKPTNVLSFVGSQPDELGDIIICPAVVRREAKASGRSFASQVNYLFIHGLLHLLGFDHTKAEKERRMLKAERELM